MEVFALIPARGGSKALPRKNTKLLAGKPMINWSIEAALQTKLVSRVVVSTEDDEIAEVSRQAGAEIPFVRPAHLATDTASTFAVVRHFVEWLEQARSMPDYVMVLQPTSPLREAADIEGAIALAAAKHPRAVIGVTELHPHMAHPWQVRRIARDGTLRNFIAGNTMNGRRQDLPEACIINGGVYLYHTSYIISKLATAIPPDALPYVMPLERSLDVDTLWDFRLADLLLRSPL